MQSGGKDVVSKWGLAEIHNKCRDSLIFICILWMFQDFSEHHRMMLPVRISKSRNGLK